MVYRIDALWYSEQSSRFSIARQASLCELMLMSMRKTKSTGMTMVQAVGVASGEPSNSARGEAHGCQAKGSRPRTDVCQEGSPLVK